MGHRRKPTVGLASLTNPRSDRPWVSDDANGYIRGFIVNLKQTKQEHVILSIHLIDNDS